MLVPLVSPRPAVESSLPPKFPKISNYASRYDSSRGPAFPFSSATTCYGKPSIPGVTCTTAPLYHINISCKEELIHYHLESRRGLYYSLVIGKETRTPTRDASSMRITTHVGVCRRQVHICSERTESEGLVQQHRVHFTSLGIKYGQQSGEERRQESK